MAKNLTFERLQHITHSLSLQSIDKLPRTACHGTKKGVLYSLLEQLQIDKPHLWTNVKDSTIMAWINDIQDECERTYLSSKKAEYTGLDAHALNIKGEYLRSQLNTLEAPMLKIGGLIVNKIKDEKSKDSELRDKAKRKALLKDRIISAAEKSGRKSCKRKVRNAVNLFCSMNSIMKLL